MDVQRSVSAEKPRDNSKRDSEPFEGAPKFSVCNQPYASRPLPF